MGAGGFQNYELEFKARVACGGLDSHPEE